MSIVPVKLKAPDGSPIIGIKLTNGAIVPFESSFGRANGQHTFFYKVPDGTVPKLSAVNGENVLVDSKGWGWPSSEVEFVSVPAI